VLVLAWIKRLGRNAVLVNPGADTSCPDGLNAESSELDLALRAYIQLKFVLAHDKGPAHEGQPLSEEQIIGILKEHEAGMRSPICAARECNYRTHGTKEAIRA